MANKPLGTAGPPKGSAGAGPPACGPGHPVMVPSDGRNTTRGPGRREWGPRWPPDPREREEQISWKRVRHHPNASVSQCGPRVVGGIQLHRFWVLRPVDATDGRCRLGKGPRKSRPPDRQVRRGGRVKASKASFSLFFSSFFPGAAASAAPSPIVQVRPWPWALSCLRPAQPPVKPGVISAGGACSRAVLECFAGVARTVVGGMVGPSRWGTTKTLPTVVHATNPGWGGAKRGPPPPKASCSGPR